MSRPLAQLGDVARLRLNGVNGGRCPVCRAPMDAHRPWCSRPDLRKCRKCAAPIPFAGLGVRYCQACREAPRCPRCLKPGGGHSPSCCWLRDRRRNVPTFHGVVTAAMLEALYVDQRRRLVRIAARIVGSADAPDVVQSVFAYLLARLDTLPHLTPALVARAVVNLAKSEAGSARWRRVRLMDEPGLLILERVEAAQRLGGRPARSDVVRLPEPVR